MVRFAFGMPVGSEYFFNREAEIRRLSGRVGKIKEGVRNDVAIIGPRRVGKSSLTNKLGEEAEKQGIACVKVDCEGLDLPLFLREYGNAVMARELERKKVFEKFEESVKQGLTAAIATLSEALGRIRAVELKSPLVDFISLRIEVEKMPQSELKGQKLYEFFVKTMELPEKLGAKFVVVLDEFQETSSYKVFRRGDFHALFRRAIQGHENVCYVYSGSSVGMMNEIFGNPRNPLSGNADTMQVGPFDEKHSREFVKLGLREEYGKKIEEDALRVIVEKTGGFPSYLNWVCLRIGEKNESRVVREKEAEAVLGEMLSPASPVYQAISKQLVKLGVQTKRVLLATAFGNTAPSTIQRESGVKNVYVYLDRLQKYGLIEKKGVEYFLIDSVLREGLEKRVFA
ncbi:ATP-binding protein [Candidatus Micrarchaeota archaeon]|nr:ATP-binding protein [Candidatus Micrarchaeota archaeon]